MSNAQKTPSNPPVVLITGALSGIGRATAFAFAREGASIVVSGRKPDVGEALAIELRDLGVKAEFIQADVRHEEDVSRMVDRTVNRFGRLDIAVNNAGTEGTPGVIADQTAASYSEIFDTNVLGVLFSLKHELRAMQAQGPGAHKPSIINVSSLLGQRAIAGVGVYTASKHAVEGLTKTAALEAAGAGIRVNAVAPGPVETPMLNRFTGNDADNKTAFLSQVPLQRAGEADEIARTIVFLSSPGAGYITGHIINADGGAGAKI